MNMRMMLLTCCGAGRMPFAPGTWGSLFAALVGAFILDIGICTGHLFIALGFIAITSALLFWLGVKASDKYIAESGIKDPSIIVIDEWVGQMIATFVFVLGISFTGSVYGSFNMAIFHAQHGIEKWLLAALLQGGLFILFRFYDIKKPLHAGWADKELQGGMGVMLDDVFAGLYAGVTALVIGWFIDAFII